MQPQNDAKKSDKTDGDVKKSDEGEDEAGASSTLARRAGLTVMTGLAAATALFFLKKDK